MNRASPLRYPGGKASMAPLLAEVRRLNQLGPTAIAEPFAGGAGASLSLLFAEETPEIYINDADAAIHDFWWTLVHRPQPFLDLLRTKRASMAEWQRQRDVYRTRSGVSRLKRGFATFYLNRCNRSGIIINGGPIGGIEQTGTWKIDARFNKSELAQRCERIAEYADRIHVSGDDGIRFIDSLNPADTMFFIDPPYYHKGDSLYLNNLDSDYHAALAAQLKPMADAAWVLTYDDCSEVRRLYEGWAAVRPISLRYVAHERRQGKEVFITPKWLKLPRSQASVALNW